MRFPSRPPVAAGPFTALSALVILATVGWGPVARADEAAPPAPIMLPTMVVTATRLPTPEEELGSAVTVITGEEI